MGQAEGKRPTGAGSDIWGTAEEFRYMHRPMTGDGTVTALNNTDVWSKRKESCFGPGKKGRARKKGSGFKSFS